MVQVNYFPPFRYALVEKTIHRGAFPKPRNASFLSTLSLKTILSLTPEPITPLQSLQDVEYIHIKVDKPKENIPLSFSKVFQILSVLTDIERAPIYLHCLGLSF